MDNDLGRKAGGDCRLRLRALMWFAGSIIKKCIVTSCSLPALVSSRPCRWLSRVTGRIVLVQVECSS